MTPALLGALFFVGVYALIRRAGRAWWAWSAGLTAAALSAFLLASPVVIEPLFNDFKPVPAGQARDALVVMAKHIAPGVPYIPGSSSTTVRGSRTTSPRTRAELAARPYRDFRCRPPGAHRWTRSRR